MAADASLATVSDAADGPALRIAVSTRSPLQGVTVDREHVRALFTTAGRLMRAGHDVERFDPTYSTPLALDGLARWFAGAASDAEHLDPSLLEPRTRQHAAMAAGSSTVGSCATRPEAWQRKASEMLTTYDVLMRVLTAPPVEAKRWVRARGRRPWRRTPMGTVRRAVEHRRLPGHGGPRGRAPHRGDADVRAAPSRPGASRCCCRSPRRSRGSRRGSGSRRPTADLTVRLAG